MPEWAAVRQYPVAELGTAVVPAAGTLYPMGPEATRFEEIAAAIQSRRAVGFGPVARGVRRRA